MLCAGTQDAAVDITTQVRAARGAELSTAELEWVEKTNVSYKTGLPLS